MLIKTEKFGFLSRLILMTVPAGLLVLFLSVAGTEAKHIEQLFADVDDVSDSARITVKEMRESDITTVTDSDFKIVRELFRKDGTDSSPVIIVERDAHHKEGQAENIESFSILKDGAAVAKYGEKGKNGVIVLRLKNADGTETVRTEEARKRAEEARKRAEEARIRAEEARIRAGEARNRIDNIRKQMDELKAEGLTLEGIEKMILKAKNDNSTKDADEMHKTCELILKELEASRARQIEAFRKLQEELNGTK